MQPVPVCVRAWRTATLHCRGLAALEWEWESKNRDHLLGTRLEISLGGFDVGVDIGSQQIEATLTTEIAEANLGFLRACETVLSGSFYIFGREGTDERSRAERGAGVLEVAAGHVPVACPGLGRC